MTRRVLAVLFAALALSTWITLACGRDVDIGGAPDDDAGSGTDAADAQRDDAEAPPLAECDPCLAAVECGEFATCAPVGGSDGFCVALCPKGNECDTDDACRTTPTVAGTQAVACVPKSDACAPAPPPTAQDGATLEQCGVLVGPTIEGSCRSCEKTSPSCQRNGCYGGWWCNTNTRRCERPPTTCG